MHRSFYGPDPAYHEARRRFVHKLPPATLASVRRLPSALRADPIRPDDAALADHQMTPGAPARGIAV